MWLPAHSYKDDSSPHSLLFIWFPLFVVPLIHTTPLLLNLAEQGEISEINLGISVFSSSFLPIKLLAHVH